MAVKYFCDGTGDEIPPGDKVETRGDAHKRYYCVQAAVSIDEYTDRIDKLHDEVALRWREGLQEIRIEYLTIKGIKALPDVPDDYLDKIDVQP